MQKITSTVELTIPPEYVLVKKSELESLKERSDYDCWWTSKDLKERYGHDLQWFREHVLYVPRFKQQLMSCVKYPKTSGKNGWQFEPHEFSRFMQNNFGQICNERR